MNRILFESSEITEGRAVFGGCRADHVVRILHGAVGQTLKTGVVDGPIGESVITAITGEPCPLGGDPVSASLRIAVTCSHTRPSLAPWIDLILALPRPRVLKRLLPQLAACGVGTIYVVGAEKVEKAYWGAQILREEVYRPYLVEGLMQSGTSVLPRLAVERHLTAWLEKGRFEATFAGRMQRIVAHPYEGPAPVLQAEGTGGRPVLAVGPEGGWTPDEVARLVAHGFRCLSLGPRILRTDTATIALLARLSAEEEKL